jgi:hypothetical protein
LAPLFIGGGVWLKVEGCGFTWVGLSASFQSFTGFFSIGGEMSQKKEKKNLGQEAPRLQCLELRPLAPIELGQHGVSALSPARHPWDARVRLADGAAHGIDTAGARSAAAVYGEPVNRVA